MPFRLLIDDLRELPVFLRLASALRRAADDGDETFGVLVRQQGEVHPDRVLLRFESETVTYGSFNDSANAYAAVLKEAGVCRGDPVALMMENSPDLLMAQAAIAKLGAIAALINTHLSGAALGHVLAAAGARHVLADPACVERVVERSEAVTMTVWGLGAPATLPPHVEPLQDAVRHASRQERDMPALHGRDPFLYIYTSGTTGYPKPAIVRHSRYTMAGIALSGLLGIRAGDVIYAPLPLYHGESNLVGFSVAMRSAATFASRRRFSARDFLADVRRHGATAFVYVGELCRYLLRQPPRPDDRQHQLRLAVGAGLRPDIWTAFQQRFGIRRIVEMYGCTEGNVSLMNRSGRVGSVGRPHPFQHRQVRLARIDAASGELQRNGKGFLVECGVGEPGELLGKIVTGSTMPYDGYTDQRATETKIVRNAFRGGDAYFRSGDILRRDAAGYYYFVDRGGDTFRWKGENVATQEVAEILNGAPGVSETSVYGVALPFADGRVGMAAVVLAGAAFDRAAFYRQTELLPPYARPLFVRLLKEMTVTGTMKQRKVELRDEAYDLRRVADPLFVCDAAARTYVPLTPVLAARIDSGELKW